jgi:Bacterial PH domain
MSDSTSPSPATPSQSSTTETVLWEGAPSSWQNFWWWVSIIGIPVAIWKHILLKCTKIVLTTQRLKISSGLLNKVMEEVELYRVKDWTFHQPLFQRMLGFGSITIMSSDRSAPQLTYGWLKDAQGLSEKLRSAVEAVRDRKRVRALEVDDQDDSGFAENS